MELPKRAMKITDNIFYKYLTPQRRNETVASATLYGQGDDTCDTFTR